MEGCHNTNWVGGDPTIHLDTIVEAIGMLDSLQMSAINKMKEYEYIESIKADNYINRYNTTLKNSESAFYQRRLFNSPQLWNSNFFMSNEISFVHLWMYGFQTLNSGPANVH
jgi:putative pyruvate formate lyase activating enzyme